MKTSLYNHTFADHLIWLVMCLAVTFATAAAEPPAADSEAASKEALGALASSPASTSSKPDPSNRQGSPESAAVLAAPSSGVLDDKHRLVIGDKISFQIQEDLDDPKEALEPKSLVVADSGEIEVPYIGRVPAESKTCQQLAAEIKTALEKEYYYQATVKIAIDLRARSRGRVYLVGPVHMPGAQEIPSDEVLTLSKAIMRAGSFNDFADKKNVKVTRKGGPGEGATRTFMVDVAQILEKGKTEGDLVLEPGDLVVIPERAIRF
jgi:polysaccharide export outer membrane protein